MHFSLFSTFRGVLKVFYWPKEASLTARRACLSFSFSVRTLCCSALSVRRLSCVKLREKSIRHKRSCFGSNEVHQDSRFCWPGRSVPLRLFFSGWSELQWETAAQINPSPDAFCGCPGTHKYIYIFTQKRTHELMMSRVKQIKIQSTIYSHQSPPSLLQESLERWCWAWTCKSVVCQWIHTLLYECTNLTKNYSKTYFGFGFSSSGERNTGDPSASHLTSTVIYTVCIVTCGLLLNRDFCHITRDGRNKTGINIAELYHKH